jgi:hypothetical protein
MNKRLQRCDTNVSRDANVFIEKIITAHMLKLGTREHSATETGHVLCSLEAYSLVRYMIK